MPLAFTRRHALALVLAPAIVATLVGAARQPAPRQVHVVARDYAFVTAPDTLPAGDVSFTFENRGAHDHELIVGRLRPGVTAQQIVATHERGITLRQLSQAYLAEGASGALLAQPGTRSPARYVVPLERGQVYVLLCQLRDSAGKPQHPVLGMFRLLHVR
jgi:hypothetical protein